MYVLLAVTIFWSILTFFTQFLHPYHNAWMGNSSHTAGADILGALGIGGMVLQAIIIVGIILAVHKRWRFPYGAFTFMFMVNGFLMIPMNDQYRFLPAIILTGLLIDQFYFYLKPENHLRKIRIFAFFAPIILYSLYMTTVFITEGVWWSIHMWLGSIFLSGLAGFLVSYLIYPQKEAGY